MKMRFKFPLLLLVVASLLTSCYSTNSISQSQVDISGGVSYQSFYDNLSPYGTWIDYPGYGNVWNPRIEAGFRPYATNGNWRYSQEGWAWQSNYRWGWAPFHYGRWIYDDMYGWLWVPGYQWSPAWVTWGSVDNYYAWAPLMPEVNIGVQFGNWRPHPYYWNVVGRDHVYDRNISNVIVQNSQNTNITKNITIINNYNTTNNTTNNNNNTRNNTNNYYSKGPDVNEVQRYTRNKIEPVSFKEVNNIKRTNQNQREMQVYRPQIQRPGNEEAGQERNTPATGNNPNGANTNSPKNRNNNYNQQNRNTQNIPAQQGNRAPNPATVKPVPATPQQFNNTVPAAPAQRPATQNPQPREFRRANNNQINPINNNSAAPILQRPQQRQNINQLPVQRFQPAGGSGNNGGGRRGGHDRRN